MARSGKRRNSGRDVHGILLLDKPLWLSSNSALQKAKRMFDARKAGHTGSLDPLATGLLPICFGQATKVSQYLIDCDKRYRATMQLGAETTTGDTEGEVTQEYDVSNVTSTKISQVISAFVGDITQIPPMYSAIKHQGKPLYKLAAKGVEVERSQRKVHIFDLKLLDFRDNKVEFDVHCSKGTYIRTLAEDMGKQLGCGAHLISLRRYAVGNYQQITPYSFAQLNEILEQGGHESLDKQLLGLDSGLAHLPPLELNDEQALRLSNGQRISVDSKLNPGLMRLYSPKSGFFGLGEKHASGLLSPSRIFHFSV